MNPPDVVRRGLVRQWLEKAGEDMEVAEELFPQADRFSGSIAFHCQQACEKYVKAFLVRHEIEFPKTHDIGKLLDLAAPVSPSLADSLRDAEFLTPFGVDIRYPSDAPELLPGGEVQAIETARRVRDTVLEALRPYLLGG